MDTPSPAPTSFSGPLEIGMAVEIELIARDGSHEVLTVTLVPDEQADFAAGFLGAGTPLGKTLLGNVAGQELPYPVADMRAVRIVTITPHGQTQAEDVAARREATTRDAVNKAEFINAMMFASAVDTKWGSYDADSLDPTQWDVNNQAKNTPPKK